VQPLFELQKPGRHPTIISQDVQTPFEMKKPAEHLVHP